MGKTEWQKRKQGKMATIETEAEIDVEEYLEYATTVALIEELEERDWNFEDLDIDRKTLINMLCNGLSITQADKVKTVIKAILE